MMTDREWIMLAVDPAHEHEELRTPLRTEDRVIGTNKQRMHVVSMSSPPTKLPWAPEVVQKVADLQVTGQIVANDLWLDDGGGYCTHFEEETKLNIEYLRDALAMGDEVECRISDDRYAPVIFTCGTRRALVMPFT